MPLLKFKALADETRIRLAAILSRYELSVNEITQILGMGQSRVSRHLKIMAEAGLLRARRDGLWAFYSAPPSGANADFLRAMLPFFSDYPQFEADLAMAAQILKERELRAKQFFNAIAAKWDDLNREILGDFDLAGKALEAMPNPCRVAVDLGCGTGAALSRMAEKAEAAIGVDSSQAMLDLCRGRLSRQNKHSASLRIGELAHLPLADHEADFACLNLVLHHLPSLESALHEARRVLGSHGILFIADFLKHSDEAMRSRYGDRWLGFEEDELRAALGSAGFAPVKTEAVAVGRKLTLILITAEISNQLNGGNGNDKTP